jgi:hypothetical protein
MEKVHQVLLWLEGKKALWGAIIATIISFLVSEGTISASMGTMIQSIVAMLTTGSVALGATQGYKDYKLGKSK